MASRPEAWKLARSLREANLVCGTPGDRLRRRPNPLLAYLAFSRHSSLLRYVIPKLVVRFRSERQGVPGKGARTLSRNLSSCETFTVATTTLCHSERV